MKKRIIAMLLACVMVTGLAACGSKEAPVETPNETEAPAENPEASDGADANIVYMNQAPTDYFEYPWWNCGCQTFTKLLFESLIGMDENMEPTTDTGMSESYELSEDGLTLTVTLRDGLKWHDGEDVTTDDVLFSIKTAIAETITTNAVLQNVLTTIEGAEEVLAGTADTFSGISVEGKTITIKFAKVNPNVLLGMSMFHIVPEHCLANADVAQFQQDPFWQNPIGSGPFKLDSCVMGEYAQFVPFEEYWDGVADFTVYTTSSAIDSDENLVTNAKAGRVDYAYTKQYADVQALEGTEGINIHPVSVLYTRFLKFNQFKRDANDTNPLADERVRQAFAYAIDRKQICEQVFEGAADPGDGTSTPTGNQWKVEGLEAYDYNPEKAKELLAEAGWDSSRTLTLGYYYTDQATADLMAILQQMLAQVGINVEPELQEGDLGTLLNAMPTSKNADGVSNVKWDILYGGLAATSAHDYYTRGHSVTGSDNCSIADPEYDALVDELISTVDADEQKAAYAKLEEYEAEAMWEVPVYYQPIWIVTSDKVDHNIQTWGNPQFSWNWDVQNWTLQ